MYYSLHSLRTVNDTFFPVGINRVIALLTWRDVPLNGTYAILDNIF